MARRTAARVETADRAEMETVPAAEIADHHLGWRPMELSQSELQPRELLSVEVPEQMQPLREVSTQMVDQALDGQGGTVDDDVKAQSSQQPFDTQTLAVWRSLARCLRAKLLFPSFTPLSLSPFLEMP
mmetsp:Transcript_25750/g.48330  ORF Transcript_25750/g.48330 Transcript_25750/m.48330 type:complete len:128 (+) Transcript_25750:68-451(+)